MNYSRVALTLGLPVAVGVGAGMTLHSILYGALIGLAAMVVILMIVNRLRPAPAWTKPGTRAWEAKLTIDVLVKTVDQRLAELETAQVDQVPKKRREIEFLAKQVDTLRAIIDSNDASPGRGYVGFDPYQGD